MKRIILSAVISLFPFILSAEFNNGPQVDYHGKPSVSTGQSLFKWLFPYNMNWRKSCFIAANGELFEWEIEKTLKKGTFKMDFFTRSYISVDYAVEYLFMRPAAASKMLPLMVLFYKTANSSNSYVTAEKILYILMKSGDDDLKQELFRQRGGQVEALAKKYDKVCSRQKLLPAEEVKKKAYDKYLSYFKSNRGFNIEDWLKHWDIENIIRDVLKKKAVNKKNTDTFIQWLLKYPDTISDSLAGEIIRYFKLDTPSPQISLVFLEALGKNPRLNWAILKNFRHIKKPEYRNSNYSLAVLILKKNIDNVSPALWCRYAAVTGDYNGAFKKIVEEGKRSGSNSVTNRKRAWDNFVHNKRFVERIRKSKDPELKKTAAAIEKTLKNPGWYPPNVLKEDKSYLQNCTGLLLKGSKLSEKNACDILENSPNLYYDKAEMEPRFAKLLPKKYFTLSSTLRLPLAAAFPFETLPPEGQKSLFDAYAGVMKKKGYLTQKTATTKKLSLLKSPVYRRKTIKLLMETESRPGDKALQVVSLKWLPELLTVAGSDDPVLAVKACELIGKTSILGKSAAKGLKSVLKNTKDFTVKIAAICALAEIGDRSSIPLLKTYYKNENRLLARAAKQAVIMLQPLDKDDILYREMLKAKKR